MPERTLVIETATTALSVALIERGAVLADRHEVVGRGHAERLVPLIAELPDGGRAGTILVDVGPGSFTGIRVGIAAARGLALGWRSAVRGFSSLALIAAAARDPVDPRALAVVIEGGHGELFMQRFSQTLEPLDQPRSLIPEAVAQLVSADKVVGNAARWLPVGLVAEERLPVAADAMLLPPGLATLPPRPFYGRAPDAKPMVAAR